MPLNSALADKPTLYVTETKVTLFKNKFLEIKLLIFVHKEHKHLAFLKVIKTFSI